MWLDVISNITTQAWGNTGWRMTLQSFMALCVSSGFNNAVKRKWQKQLFLMWCVSHEQLCSRMLKELFIKKLLVSHPKTLLLQEWMSLCWCLLHSSLFILNDFVLCCFHLSCSSLLFGLQYWNLYEIFMTPDCCQVTEQTQRMLAVPLSFCCLPVVHGMITADAGVSHHFPEWACLKAHCGGSHWI